jgi:Putative DNA-binding domain
LTLRRVPLWLEELELRFGAMLALPLDRQGGTLRATPGDYDPDLDCEVRPGPRAPGHAGLAVYQRQYWFRLFTTLQSAFPLTTRLLGHWHFNDLAARFLSAHPPTGCDIDDVADGFDRFLTEVIPGRVVTRVRPRVTLDVRALREAARIDAAYHRVFRAAEVLPFRPTAADSERLLSGRLVLSAAVALLLDGFGLCELRRSIANESSEAPVPAPARLAAPRHWALVRKGLTLGLVPLEPLEFELLELLGEHPVGEALARLEASCSTRERRNLPERARRWLARSVEFGFWSGLCPANGERPD